jgi:hypothetical protein
MSIGLLFWILMVIWFAFWMMGRWTPQPWSPVVNDVFLFILFFLLGWHAFGFVIHA